MSGASAIFIGTTEGPVQVLSILRETGDPPSAVFLNGGTSKLRISAAYREFIERPSGFIERICGHRAFRTDLSGRIDGGESWQLGMLVAHITEADGRLVRQVEEARRVIWCSGSVRNVPGSASDIAVGGIDFLPQKLQLSEQMLRAAADRGSEVWIALSERDDSPEVRALIGRLCPSARVVALGRMQLAAFETFWKRTPAPRPRSIRTSLVAGVALLAVAAGVLLATGKLQWPAVAAPIEAPSQGDASAGTADSASAPRASWRTGVTVQIHAAVARPGESCFSASATQPVDAAYTLMEFRETAIRGKLCGARLVIVNRTSAPITVSLAGEVERGGLAARTVQPAQSDYLVLGPAHRGAQLLVRGARDEAEDFSGRLFASADGVNGSGD